MSEKSEGLSSGERLSEVISVENLVEHVSDVFETALQSAFDKKRDLFVHEMAVMLSGAELIHGAEGASEDQGTDWVGVESLSRLRNMVGGRFQNLKKKWIGAGFPLREHRGDKGTDYELDETGWIELSNWILKQGYEARLTPSDPEYLFELRPVGK